MTPFPSGWLQQPHKDVQASCHARGRHAVVGRLQRTAEFQAVPKYHPQHWVYMSHISSFAEFFWVNPGCGRRSMRFLALLKVSS